jgi:hypothetical protein
MEVDERRDEREEQIAAHSKTVYVSEEGNGFLVHCTVKRTEMEMFQLYGTRTYL